MVVELISRRDHEAARQLVESNGFVFERNFDVLVGIYESGNLIATAARDHNIFKMICIQDEFQGGGLLGELLTALLASCDTCVRDNFFIYTKPDRRQSFEQFNFKTLVEHPSLCLLEYGRGLEKYLQLHHSLIKKGDNGAVVINANPFTLGHQYLIEQAAKQVDHLYVFVVREDCSVFPFDLRFRLVQKGTAHLGNVSVLETSDYAVSSVTFPAYFLKSEENLQCLQMEIDLLLFARKLALPFFIKKRFIGTEPNCLTTRYYSEVMLRVLQQEGVETVQLQRKTISSQAISASRVRDLLKQEAFEELCDLVPDTTLEYLKSDEAQAIRQRMKTYQRRH